MWHNAGMPRPPRQPAPPPAAPREISPEQKRERALAQWAHGDPDRMDAALSTARPDAKHFRSLFAGLASRPGQIADWAQSRACRLAADAWNARGARHVIFDSERARAVAIDLNLAPHDAASVASSEPGLLTLVQFDEMPAPGSLAPSTPAALRLARFLERREDPSWARRLRREHGTYFMGDPMLLSLLRRVEPEGAQHALNCALLCAALAGGGVEAALSLGADPMGLCFFGFKSAPTNLLGAILRMSPSYLLSDHVPEIFAPGRDAILEQSARLALACAPADESARFLSLLAEGARRPTGWPGAAALSMQRGHQRCARLFLNMGSAPTGSQLAAARSEREAMNKDTLLGFKFPDPSRRAWSDLDAMAEACVLREASRPRRGAASAPARSAPRL